MSTDTTPGAVSDKSAGRGVDRSHSSQELNQADNSTRKQSTMHPSEIASLTVARRHVSDLHVISSRRIGGRIPGYALGASMTGTGNPRRVGSALRCPPGKGQAAETRRLLGPESRGGGRGGIVWFWAFMGCIHGPLNH